MLPCPMLSSHSIRSSSASPDLSSLRALTVSAFSSLSFSSLRNLQPFQRLTLPRAIPFRMRISEKQPPNPFRMRSFKTKDLKPFRMCSFRKTGVGAPLRGQPNSSPSRGFRAMNLGCLYPFLPFDCQLSTVNHAYSASSKGGPTKPNPPKNAKMDSYLGGDSVSTEAVAARRHAGTHLPVTWWKLEMPTTTWHLLLN
jgi:hypothetical protein